DYYCCSYTTSSTYDLF
nr:immunoglobulin light chain junction region [Macaca mulatta]